VAEFHFFVDESGEFDAASPRYSPAVVGVLIERESLRRGAEIASVIMDVVPWVPWPLHAREFVDVAHHLVWMDRHRGHPVRCARREHFDLLSEADFRRVVAWYASGPPRRGSPKERADLNRAAGWLRADDALAGALRAQIDRWSTQLDRVLLPAARFGPNAVVIGAGESARGVARWADFGDDGQYFQMLFAAAFRAATSAVETTLASPPPQHIDLKIHLSARHVEPDGPVGGVTRQPLSGRLALERFRRLFGSDRLRLALDGHAPVDVRFYFDADPYDAATPPAYVIADWFGFDVRNVMNSNVSLAALDPAVDVGAPSVIAAARPFEAERAVAQGNSPDAGWRKPPGRRWAFEASDVWMGRLATPVIAEAGGGKR